MRLLGPLEFVGGILLVILAFMLITGWLGALYRWLTRR